MHDTEDHHEADHEKPDAHDAENDSLNWVTVEDTNTGNALEPRRHAIHPISQLQRRRRPARAEPGSRPIGAALPETSQRVWSYAEVAQAADAAGAGLLGLGLERGDRVILFNAGPAGIRRDVLGAIKAGVVRRCSENRCGHGSGNRAIPRAPGWRAWLGLMAFLALVSSKRWRPWSKVP